MFSHYWMINTFSLFSVKARMSHCNVNIWPGESPLDIYHELSAREIVASHRLSSMRSLQ